MIIPTKPLALAVLSMCTLAGHSTLMAASPNVETIVLVGRLAEIQEVDPCASAEATDQAQEHDEKLCMPFDAIFNARYDVQKVVYGHLVSDTITLRISDHHGFPDFARYRDALLFVGVASDGYFLHKYQGFPVYRTTDGGWTTCGANQATRSDEESPYLKRVELAQPLGVAGALSEYGVKQLFGDSVIIRPDGSVHCTHGISLGDLYELVRTGVMESRGHSLGALYEDQPQFERER